ncbi:hypothetical protein LPJ57_009642 [Coemansia sp. RSA 486]|nr:hypothetical protein LPJ57_009642 [Coemansia sp. RSA 486]
MPMMNMYKNQLFQIHVLGKPAVDGLQRPWVPENPFAALTGASTTADAEASSAPAPAAAAASPAPAAARSSTDSESGSDAAADSDDNAEKKDSEKSQ